MSYGALFDWDGVVIDSSAHHDRSWTLLAKEIGKPLPADHFVRGFGMKNQAIIPDILGWTDDAEQIEALSLRKELLYRQIIARDGITPLPGVVELLQLLNSHGVPCSVASSTHRQNIEAVFDMTGLRKYFAAVVTAEDVNKGKPHPDVFLKSAAAIDRPAGQCVVFEDALVGIAAGLAAGAKVIAVATTCPLEALGDAHLAVRSLAEIDWPVFSGLLKPVSQ
jgi:HAD superfamily hydrolase (TIGR01509 family)